MKKTTYFWEYKVGINAIIAYFVCLWKCRMKKILWIENFLIENCYILYETVISEYSSYKVTEMYF